MTARRIVLACILFVLAIAAVDASAQQPRKQRVVGDDDAVVLDPGPAIVFKRFEAAWRAGNANDLASLAGEAPVLVELRGYDRKGGYFTRAQLLYIFKDLFRSTKQLDFDFVRYHNIEKQDRRVYGIAQRSYRSGSSAGLLRDKVYVTLVKEDARWAVAEIKSTW